MSKVKKATAVKEEVNTIDETPVQKVRRTPMAAPRGLPKDSNINWLESRPSNPNAKKSIFGWCDSVTGEVLVSAYGAFTPEINMDRPNCPPGGSTPSNIPVTKIELKFSGEETIPGLEMGFPLDPKVFPENATDKSYTWEISDPTVLKIDPDTTFITTLKVGEAVILCQSVSNPEVTASLRVIVVTA